MLWQRVLRARRLRLFPGAPYFDRRALAEDRLAGERIPRGSLVMISPYVLHRTTRFWSAPAAFRPARFAPGGEGKPLRIHPDARIPILKRARAARAALLRYDDGPMDDATQPHRHFGLSVALSVGVVGSLAALPACFGHGDCSKPWVAPMPYMLPFDANIRGGGLYSEQHGEGQLYVVGDDGLVLELYGDRRVYHAADVDLNAIAVIDDQVIVVGRSGTLATAPAGSNDWQLVDLGTKADLWDVATLPYRHTVIVGDGVVFLHDPVANIWSPIPPPEGGWGQLRAVGAGDRRFVMVGHAGAIWSTLGTPDLEHPWIREDAGTVADLTTIATPTDDIVVVGGREGTLLSLTNGRWQRIPSGVDADILDIDGTNVASLTADGEVWLLNRYDLSAPPELLFDLGVGPRVLLTDYANNFSLIALGTAGTHQRIENQCYPSE